MGFPRTRAQAEFLWQNWDIDRVIYIDIPDGLVFERVMTRGKEGMGIRLHQASRHGPGSASKADRQLQSADAAAADALPGPGDAGHD